MVLEQKFETVDGYGMIDIADAPIVVGPVRSAKKVLQRTTQDLIRHATYAIALHERNGSGGAAALNHDRASDDQSPIAAFAEELETWAARSHFTATAGLGLGASEIGPTLHASAAMTSDLIAASAASCVPADTTTIVIVSDGEEPALRDRLSERANTSFVPDMAAGLTSGADVVLVRGTAGSLDHDVVAESNVGRIISLDPLLTTPRGLAVASRQGSIIVPDFLSASGPYLAALSTSDSLDDLVAEIARATTSAIERIGDVGVDMFVRASELAEGHLRTWTSDLPFGRPLAP